MAFLLSTELIVKYLMEWFFESLVDHGKDQLFYLLHIKMIYAYYLTYDITI